MINHSRFTIQLLEKIGSPLTAAIDYVLLGGDDKEVEAAQIMAQLLGQATQMSTALYNILEIKEEEDQVDSTRLALAALVSPLIAESYKHRKKVPSAEDTSRLGKSLEALISFGESFSPAAECQSRLQTIDHDTVFFDKEQPSFMILQAMVPVINAVEEFSFGQSKIKLVQNIATKLESTSSEVSKKLAGKNGSTDKLKELIVFKVLAELYTSCHLAETQRASSATDVALSLDPVWESFATKVSMIEAFMGFEEMSESTQAVPSSKEVIPEKEQVKEVPSSSSSSGPMGFFTKDSDKDPDSTEDAPTPQLEKSVEKQDKTATPAPVEKAENKTEGKHRQGQWGFSSRELKKKKRLKPNN